MQVTKGARIELVSLNDPYSMLRAGDLGTVVAVHEASERQQRKVSVMWDSGSRLSLLPDEGDQFQIVQG